MKQFVGLDFAYANNGVIILDEEAKILISTLIITKKPKSDEERLTELVEKLESYLDIENTEAVYIEGLSYGSKGQAVSQLGAAHFLTRIFLWKKQINYKIIEPTVLKKFVTGKGQCKKDLILLKVFKRFGVEFESNDLADAYSLARMALEDYKK